MKKKKMSIQYLLSCISPVSDYTIKTVLWTEVTEEVTEYVYLSRVYEYIFEEYSYFKLIVTA